MLMFEPFSISDDFIYLVCYDFHVLIVYTNKIPLQSVFLTGMVTLECTHDGGLTLEINLNCNDRVLNFYIEIYKNHYTVAYYR